MTKTQYFQLKHLLKTISNVIKASKCDLKHIEKTYSTLSKDESLSKNFPQTQRFVTDSIFHDLCFSRKNIIWYKRANIEGPKESIEYLNRKIQELNTLLSTDNVNHISSSL